ncbi:MAG TPA: YlbF family regulator [Sporomusaceae bacterium]|uniref:YlbF family regulator n=1 Tax=Anaerospora sp. TaxID=1960278 RepID=UPI000ED65993|nr:YlbF family regulator [Anaerospora sp.]MDF2929116.1 hypothetical protein [Anaerospora sp.]HAK73954.1 YlbF family regulator [Sporomusaceae bacterium]
MNSYDKAHELARALQSSSEYQQFLTVKKAIDSDGPAKKMIKDFLARQMEIEYERMAGKGEDKEKMAQLQKMAELISFNPAARDFLQAHMRFQRVMADVYKILGDSIAEGMDIFAKD